MLSLDNTWPFRDKDKPQEGIPIRMVGTWTDTVLSQAGQKSQRGFGGRILFYEKEGKKPILVDGQLVVYAFDETGRDATDNKPTRRYVFPADQMPLHMSKSELGASYSFWLPWDEAGGVRTEVSLICRFEPKGGAVVTSEQTKHLLPGAAPPAAVAGAKTLPKLPSGVPSKPPRQTLEGLQSSRADDRRAQLISYEAPVGGDSQAVAGGGAASNGLPEKHLSSTTIALPQNYQMPDVAAIRAAMPPISYKTVQAQTPTQYSPTAGQYQPAAMQAQQFGPNTMAAAVPPGFTQPYKGPQSSQQIPVVTPAQMNPGQQPLAAAPTSWNSVAPGQLQPQQMQQTQQQPVQQQLLQQAAPGQPALQAWPQTPAQGAPATALNYPTQAQLAR